MPDNWTTTRRTERGARILTLLFALATVWAGVLWVALRWEGRRRTTWIETLYGLFNVPLAPTLTSLVVLGLITNALMRRKRVALLAVAGFQVVGMVFSFISLFDLNIVSGWVWWSTHRDFTDVLDALTLGIGTAMLVVLWLLRRAFPGKLQRGSMLISLAALACGLALTVALTWGLLALNTPSSDVPRWRQVVAALRRSLGDTNQAWRRYLIDIPLWIPQVTSLLVSVALVTAVLLFLRTAKPENRWSGQREVTIRTLLTQMEDADSLSYFATRRDKSSIFSPDQKAVITYRVRNGVSLASGDPIGNPASWPGAIAAWRSEARRYGWIPAVLSASEPAARAYAEAGLHVITLGDEAILEPDRFSLGNTSMSAVRHAAKRAQRAGLEVEIRRQEQIEPDELAEILTCIDLWRGEEPDRGFSMALNRLGDASDGKIVYVTARDAKQRLMGVLSFVPWGRRGLSLDVMRRSPLAPNGVTELLVSQLMAEAAKHRVAQVSLNFCMFGGVYAGAAQLGANSFTRFNYSVLGVLDRFWQLERLYRANQKFEPRWRARFLCYQDTISLPQVAIAAASCEGFLPQGPFTRRPRVARLTREQQSAIAELAAAAAPTVVMTRRRISDQSRVRLDHLQALEKSGRGGYPVAVLVPTDTLAQLGPDRWGPTGSVGSRPVRVAARVRALRHHGGVLFATLTDDGVEQQLLLDAATLGRQALREFNAVVDTGDLIMVDAVLGFSRTGTASLLVNSWQMMAKALHPLPFRAFTNPQARLRQRSTDLIVNPNQAQQLRQRSLVVRSVRHTLDQAGFLEVETPILHTIHGGATARPFTTYINAYGMDLSMRIAPELYLKRLLIGGMGPIYEMGRNFRNEGADATHNPEFTSLEVYQPYADYTTMRLLTQQLIVNAAQAIYGEPVLPLRSATEAAADCEQELAAAGHLRLTNVADPWPVVPMLDALSDAVGLRVSLDMDFDQLLHLARSHGVAVHEEMGPGTLLEELYAELVEPATTSPTFYTDFPQETSPLTRPHRSKPGLVERWDLVINGMEVGTAYSELTDPIDQRQRLTDQSLKAAGGDVEAMEIDEDFLYALELGMPPTGGMGLGIDRLVMLLTGTTIRSVLSFPFVKPLPRGR